MSLNHRYITTSCLTLIARALTIIAMTLAGCDMRAVDDQVDQAERDQAKRERVEIQEAIDELTSAIESAPEPNADMYEERGDLFRELGKFDEAFGDYSKARTLDVSLRVAKKRLPIAIQVGEYREALNDARVLGRYSTSDPDDIAVLAMVLAKSPDEQVKNAKAALGYARYAREIDADYKTEALIERALAAAYSANGDFQAAVRHQERAIAAVKGEVRAELKAELAAYKAGKEYPFQKPSRDLQREQRK